MLQRKLDTQKPKPKTETPEAYMLNPEAALQVLPLPPEDPGQS